jgi:hypothetical protein
MLTLALLAAGLAGAAPALAADAPASVLKNGSFEGSMRYWFNTAKMELVRGDAAAGEFAVRVPTGYLQSAPFPLEDGKAFTVSLSLRADADTTVGVTVTPSHREVGQKAGLAWKDKWKFPATKAWTRHTFTFTPAVGHEHWWPNPVYMLQIGTGGKHTGFVVDAVSVALAGGEDAYLPRRTVEVVADSPDLKGYTDAGGNLLEKGARVTLIANASNPGPAARTVTLRWQLVDYEGVRPVSPAVEREVVLAPGKTVTETATLDLAATGLVLARVTALEAGKELDRSDLPLTSLPYPKAATAPDWRERYGVSLWGLHQGSLAQRVGFRWSRWYPHMNWGDVQRDGPDEWRFFDDEIKGLADHGYSVVAVLYGKPKWAFASKDDCLPKDMQWAAADPRWDDLAVVTAWDKFLTTIVKHHAANSIIWEIENEPELDHWADKDVYAKFTIRTARRIREANPKAVVMQDSMWPGPTPFQKEFFARGGAKAVDAFSWHDYHEGWLLDARGIGRMRQALDEAGGKDVEIWFDEGWTFTNPSADEPALAMGRLTGAESANAMFASVAECTAAGQEKTILFHTGYEKHGMSWWDYYPPGTMLWDFSGYPMALVGAWNTLIHHTGLSERVALVRPAGANFCIFQDLRNARGVMVAYADRDAKADVTVDLPLDGLVAEDIMGNAAPLPGPRLTLAANGRPVVLYAADKTPGKVFAEKMAGMDRTLESFVAQGGSAYRLPAAWEGKTKGSTEGNPLTHDGRPVWRLDQIWPDDPSRAANYVPLVWNGQEWEPADKTHTQGGQPRAAVVDGKVNFSTRAPWTNNEGQKIAALVFIVPKTGTYTVRGTVHSKPWEGGAKALGFRLLAKDGQAANLLKTIELPRGEDVPLGDVKTDLREGQELVFVPEAKPWHNASTITLKDLEIRFEGAAAP